MAELVVVELYAGSIRSFALDSDKQGRRLRAVRDASLGKNVRQVAHYRVTADDQLFRDLGV